MTKMLNSFQSELNRVIIETPVDANDPSKGVTKKSYDLAANDFFWVKNACLPFPQVAEEIGECNNAAPQQTYDGVLISFKMPNTQNIKKKRRRSRRRQVSPILKTWSRIPAQAHSISRPQ